MEVVKEPPAEPDLVREATDHSLSAELRRAEVVLVDFTSDGCLPCRFLLPVLEDVAAFYHHAGAPVAFVKVDIDRAPAAAAAHRIASPPTLVVFRHGQAVERIVGVAGEPVLRAAIERARGAGTHGPEAARGGAPGGRVAGA